MVISCPSDKTVGSIKTVNLTGDSIDHMIDEKHEMQSDEGDLLRNELT